jgi:hypothetical protein
MYRTERFVIPHICHTEKNPIYVLFTICIHYGFIRLCFIWLCLPLSGFFQVITHNYPTSHFFLPPLSMKPSPSPFLVPVSNLCKSLSASLSLCSGSQRSRAERLPVGRGEGEGRGRGVSVGGVSLPVDRPV